MARYRDFMLQQGDSVKAIEVVDNSAIILAIRNILLSRQGNYPFNPSFGMNIEKYQFDLLDDEQLDIIKGELSRQIAKYIPDISGINIKVEIVKDEEGIVNNGENMLGITLVSKVNSQSVSSSFLLYEQSGEIAILNETN